ncbi:hypothetical protein BU16DRAFT_66024 [Lophium mytilinum]|uniref:Uncharacterized protein n=1 Tax=Lophium mytilinum TaxID=390894 RepID=A0A6A6QQZ3_9PEZI|nr:hypothetical protein BU16DRAFT_66024 [Lophium mytilinum]
MTSRSTSRRLRAPAAAWGNSQTFHTARYSTFHRENLAGDLSRTTPITSLAQPQDQSVRNALHHTVTQDIKHLKETNERLEADNRQLETAERLPSHNTTLLSLNKRLYEKNVSLRQENTAMQQQVEQLQLQCFVKAHTPHPATPKNASPSPPRVSSVVVERGEVVVVEGGEVGWVDGGEFWADVLGDGDARL